MSKYNLGFIADKQKFNHVKTNPKMDEVLCQISWTVQDLADAFVERHKKIPTNDELNTIVCNLSSKRLQDYCIENGWDYIYDVVDNI